MTAAETLVRRIAKCGDLDDWSVKRRLVHTVRPAQTSLSGLLVPHQQSGGRSRKVAAVHRGTCRLRD